MNSPRPDREPEPEPDDEQEPPVEPEDHTRCPFVEAGLFEDLI